MNSKNERLIFALGEVDEKYIKETESRMKSGTLIKSAVAFAIVLALGLYLFIPFAPVTSDISDYESSSYFPLIEKIDAYSLAFKQPKYKNNFEWLGSEIEDLFSVFAPKYDMEDAPTGAVPDMGMDGANGSYVESTDNQVAGVIESDLMKMTDKYIFRLGYDALRVYSIEKENSSLVSEYEIDKFDGEQYRPQGFMEMYLSLDGSTVTLLQKYSAKIGIISLDISDVNNITEKGRVLIDGTLNTSRMVDGRLLLVTDFSFYRGNVDYSNPETFVPTIDSGNGSEPIKFEDIIYPEDVDNTCYSVVALLDSENLTLLGANALLNFTSDVYVSENNVFITREYTERTETENGGYTTSAMSDIAVLDYSCEALEEKGVITVRGQAEDQYSFDEKDGYLRVVTSTNDGAGQTNGQFESFTPGSRNVSLYIFDLSDNSLAYSVEDFAIEGEEATAVRFDGDKLYVCTAVVVSFTDPVYFIDLSDYENISSVDTGVIEGFSDHLINYGEGLLLGIGQENWQYNKVEIYEEEGDRVNGTFKYKFEGDYSRNYKAYLVNREENVFGFGVDYFVEHDEQNDTYRYYQAYVLISFDGSEMTVKTFKIDDLAVDTVRAAYIDGYLYITTPEDLIVEKAE